MDKKRPSSTAASPTEASAELDRRLDWEANRLIDQWLHEDHEEWRSGPRSGADAATSFALTFTSHPNLAGVKLSFDFEDDCFDYLPTWNGGLAAAEAIPHGHSLIAAALSHLGQAAATRSVLAYVADKAGALREFRRILRPGGRLSIGEPIFKDEAATAAAIGKALGEQPTGSQDRFMALLRRWKLAQFPDAMPDGSPNPLIS